MYKSTTNDILFYIIRADNLRDFRPEDAIIHVETFVRDKYILSIKKVTSYY